MFFMLFRRLQLRAYLGLARVTQQNHKITIYSYFVTECTRRDWSRLVTCPL